jgi:hypothetical protein
MKNDEYYEKMKSYSKTGKRRKHNKSMITDSNTISKELSTE